MQIKACWAYKTECCSGKKHINTHTSEAETQLCRVWCWAQEPSVTNYNWIVTPVQQKARLLQASAQQWAAPSACAPLSSTSASFLSYLEAKKTVPSFYLWSPQRLRSKHLSLPGKMTVTDRIWSCMCEWGTYSRQWIMWLPGSSIALATASPSTLYSYPSSFA